MCHCRQIRHFVLDTKAQADNAKTQCTQALELTGRPRILHTGTKSEDLRLAKSGMDGAAYVMPDWAGRMGS